MGYTTKFSGSFTVTPRLSYEHAAEFRARVNDEEWPEEFKDRIPPRSYCQWVPTKDRTGIEWDRGEKFYEYDAWIELLAAWLRSKGYAVSGSVAFRGESFDDVGHLSIVDGVAKKGPLPVTAWGTLPERMREIVLSEIERIARDANSEEEGDAYRAALATLHIPAS